MQAFSQLHLDHIRPRLAFGVVDGNADNLSVVNLLVERTSILYRPALETRISRQMRSFARLPPRFATTTPPEACPLWRQ